MTDVVHPLTADRWHDLEAVFAARGCSQARRCWCMFYRRSGKDASLPTAASAVRDRAALRALAASDRPPGLLAYRDGVPVGWISLGPREDFIRLARSPAMKRVDDRPVWSIVCFVVPSAYRGRGIARDLLGAATAYARERGAALLEAYPVDDGGERVDTATWFGAKSMFDDAGFVEVARRKPTRPVVRLSLKGD